MAVFIDLIVVAMLGVVQTGGIKWLYNNYVYTDLSVVAMLGVVQTAGIQWLYIH